MLLDEGLDTGSVYLCEETAIVSDETVAQLYDRLAAMGAGLIVMSTDGRNGFLDALRGSHSERVLRQAPCPLLTVPEGWHAGFVRSTFHA